MGLFMQSENRTGIFGGVGEKRGRWWNRVCGCDVFVVFGVEAVRRDRVVVVVGLRAAVGAGGVDRGGSSGAAGDCVGEGRMKKETLFMETTKISPSQTVSEIQRVLGRYGACAILVEYVDGEVSAVSFKINVNGQEIPFRLPCRPQSIIDHLVSRKKRIRKYFDLSAQAERVAWRQILRWVEAQLALTQTGMAKLQEVFMPYISFPNGETFYERLEGSKFKMLSAKAGVVERETDER